MNKLKGSACCLLAAVFWGVAVVAQQVGGDYVQPFTFTAARYTLGGFVLLLIVLVKDAIVGKRQTVKPTRQEKKEARFRSLFGGLVCGLVLCVATNLQQVGLMYTTAGKSGFITSCYIILVPIIGIFLKRKCPFFVWISVVLAVVGLYFLCMSGGFGGFGKGEAITMGCSLAFACHITVIDASVRKADGVKIACVQTFTCAAASWALALVFETVDLSTLLQAYVPLLYTGIMSAGVAYTLQILGQKNLPPTVASLVMSVESVVSVIAAWLILKQALTVREIIGCVIIFAAVLIAQLPQKKRVIKVAY